MYSTLNVLQNTDEQLNIHNYYNWC